jgi:hypothetical protein
MGFLTWFVTEAGPRYQAYSEKPTGRKPPDKTGNGYAWRFMCERRDAGDNEQTAMAKLRADKGPAGEWARRVDKRQLDRVWQRSHADARAEWREKKYRSERKVGVQSDWQDDFKRLDQVERREPDWLWHSYFARGEVTIVQAPPGFAKSFLLQTVAKHACDGEMRLLPSPRQEASAAGQLTVLAFDADNSTATITRARLEWAGCKNMGRYIQKEEPFSIEDNYDRVVASVREFGADIVVFDVVNYYLVGESAKPDIARTVMLFKRLARACNCSVVLVRWLTKARGDGSAIHAGQGNIGITGNASIELNLGNDPDTPAAYLLAHSKTRLVKKPVGALEIFITPIPLKNDPERARIEFGEYREGVTADDLMIKPGRPSDARETAKQILQEILKDGPKEAEEIYRRGEGRSVSPQTMRRAAKELGVEMSGAKGRTERSIWSL